MLQEKVYFNQSSVSLEIVGLPDHSNIDNKDQISIISQWKLKIINKPLIEGNIDHLTSVMQAFYSYSNFLINNEIPLYESTLIDIKAINYFSHNVLLKSSKPNVKPLNIEIGNSILSDILNCFDQFNSSNKVKKINFKTLKKNKSNVNLNLVSKNKILNILLPPLISVFSIFFLGSTFIYFYDYEENEEKVFLNTVKNSFKSI